VKRNIGLYVDDMCAAADAIADYSRGLTREAFETDRRTVDAVVRNLEVLGEAAKHIPTEIRAQHPGIDWRGMTGMRDVLIHDYFDVDEDILWEVVSQRIPALREALPQLRAAYPKVGLE
jgi:uncharacterized protein with HEPN domain